jgi:hypothetical protein
MRFCSHTKLMVLEIIDLEINYIHSYGILNMHS